MKAFLRKWRLVQGVLVDCTVRMKGHACPKTLAPVKRG